MDQHADEAGLVAQQRGEAVRAREVGGPGLPVDVGRRAHSTQPRALHRRPGPPACQRPSVRAPARGRLLACLAAGVVHASARWLRKRAEALRAAAEQPQEDVGADDGSAQHGLRSLHKGTEHVAHTLDYFRVRFYASRAALVAGGRDSLARGCSEIVRADALTEIRGGCVARAHPAQGPMRGTIQVFSARPQRTWRS